MLLSILVFICGHSQWASAEDRVYNFSFSKAAVVKPAVVAKPKKKAAVAKTAVAPATSVVAPKAPVSEATAVTPSAPATPTTPLLPPVMPVSAPVSTTSASVSSSLEATPPRHQSLEASVAAGTIVDRKNKATGGIVGAKYELWHGLNADAQILGAKRVDGSLGLAWKFDVEKYLPKFSPRVVGGILSTAGGSGGTALRPYYGLEAGYGIGARFLAVGGIRLQDDSRFGLVQLGLGFLL